MSDKIKSRIGKNYELEEGQFVDNTLSWFVAGPFMYVAVLVFVVATAKKVFSIMGLPRHLRWDLYPVAHDGPKGSIYQEVDHWEKERRYSLSHELAEMAEEILLLKRTFLYNRRMWNFTYPMHLGFYLVIGWLALILLGAAIQLATGLKISDASTSFWAQALNVLTVITGVTGLLTGLIGTAGILYIRLTDEDLKDFSPPVTFLNLYLLLALFGVGLTAWWTVDPSFVLAREYMAALLTFKSMNVPGIMVLESFLFACFLIYLPFSRMLHFAAKYFFYHNIMWEDEPVTKGSKLEQDIAGYLGYQMEWSASHIVPNGSWLNQAGTNPTVEVKKNEAKSADTGHVEQRGGNFPA